ncbi:hypothetical protein HCN44_007196 [Aphidius gifuensis]|uniref:Uncharacterized protein n=1 Tax=Aphidius gifuensis TaxID=684658 RepID=A0A834XLF3_APHGI|nr:hypothetical protein HCN44_007196 [Aphidius gifuensis]
MSTFTQSQSQELENFEADIMNVISNNVPGWNDLIDTVMIYTHGAMSSSVTTTKQFAPFKPYLRYIEKHIEQLQ